MPAALKIPAGTKFGRLTVIRETERKLVGIGDKKQSKRQFYCRCECGNKINVIVENLTNNRTKSCGCLSSETTAARNKTHGESLTRLYNIWAGMVQRCTNPNTQSWHRYGGRGITVCERWKSYENFKKDMIDGYSDDLTIDRINNDKGYSKKNCRWVTNKENCNNQSRTIRVRFRGKERTLGEVAKMLGEKYDTVHQRWETGNPLDQTYEDQKARYDDKGEMLTISELSKRYGVHKDTIRWRIRQNIPVDGSVSLREKPKHPINVYGIEIGIIKACNLLEIPAHKVYYRMEKRLPPFTEDELGLLHIILSV